MYTSGMSNVRKESRQFFSKANSMRFHLSKTGTWEVTVTPEGEMAPEIAYRQMFGTLIEPNDFFLLPPLKV